jgi:hypothetical protein
LFQKLGIADRIKGKVIKIEATPVGEAVASGNAEIGFQQISELLPVKGIDIVGLLPPGAQRVTFFAAGIPSNRKESGSRQEAHSMACVARRLCSHPQKWFGASQVIRLAYVRPLTLTGLLM